MVRALTFGRTPILNVSAAGVVDCAASGKCKNAHISTIIFLIIFILDTVDIFELFKAIWLLYRMIAANVQLVQNLEKWI